MSVGRKREWSAHLSASVKLIGSDATCWGTETVLACPALFPLFGPDNDDARSKVSIPKCGVRGVHKRGLSAGR